MDWDNLRYFLELARVGTLAAAARRMVPLLRRPSIDAPPRRVAPTQAIRQLT